MKLSDRIAQQTGCRPKEASGIVQQASEIAKQNEETRIREQTELANSFLQKTVRFTIEARLNGKYDRYSRQGIVISVTENGDANIRCTDSEGFRERTYDNVSANTLKEVKNAESSTHSQPQTPAPPQE